MLSGVPRRPDKRILAAEAWRGLFDFIIATADHRNQVVAQLGLTPNDSRALGSLERASGRTMSALAKEWRCDASTATWIVDRLEKRGLVERRAAPTDRRVTLVVLSPGGLKTKAQLTRGIYKAPPELLALETGELAALRDAVAPLATRPESVPAAPPQARERRRRAAD